jgi:hypothetical protein
MVTSAGRVDLGWLQRLALSAPPEEFVRFVQRPVLAGSAIHQGTLAAPPTAREMNRTVLFEPVDDVGAGSVSDSLRHAIYPLVKGTHSTTPANFYSVGRVDGNDFILPDYAISRRHALIEVRREGILLKDSQSTNGTFLNGARLEKKPVLLSDRDVVGFARYEFTVLTPESLYAMLRG